MAGWRLTNRTVARQTLLAAARQTRPAADHPDRARPAADQTLQAEDRRDPDPHALALR